MATIINALVTVFARDIPRSVAFYGTLMGFTETYRFPRTGVPMHVEFSAGGTTIAKLAEAVRLFMVPGMYHCRGGPGADNFGGSGQAAAPSDASHDILWALIDWVEHQRAPERIVATRLVADRPRFTRALCAFPQSAVYDGVGNTDDAGAFACRRDALLQRE
eukprot:gene39878-biopygen26717